MTFRYRVSRDRGRGRNRPPPRRSDRRSYQDDPCRPPPCRPLTHPLPIYLPMPTISSPLAPANGKTSFELKDLLHALQAVRVGDFSVRLAGDQPGHRRQDRRHLQRDRRRQRAHGAAARARRPGRRPRGQDAPARQVRPRERRLGRDGDLGQHADRRSAVADHAR